MAVSADGLALLFRLQAKDEASPVVSSAAKKISGDVKGMEAAFGGMGQSVGPTLAQLKSGFVAAASAAAVVGGAAIAAGAAIFNLAKSAADAGSEFHDLSLQTGLSVETLSGLQLQLKQSGTDMNALGNASIFLQKNLGAAASGNKELQRTFAALGVKDVDAALRDTDGTLRTVVRSLGQMESAGERNAAGSKVMGRGFKELSVFIADTGGDLDAVIEKAREAGQVMSTEAADAADAFGDQLDALSNAASIAGRIVGMEAIPQITGAMRDLTGATEGNIGVLRAWGKELANIIQFTRVVAGTIGELSFWDTGRDIAGKIEKVYARIARQDAQAAGKLFDLNAPLSDEQKASGARERERALGAIGLRPGSGEGAGQLFTPGPAGQKARKDELDKLQAFAKEWDFVISSVMGGKHNAGSLHAKGRAIDVDVRGKSAAEIERFMAAARQAGYGVRDERVRPPGQKVWSNPHIHLTTQNKAAQAAAKDAEKAAVAVTKAYDEQEKVLDRLARAIADANLESEGFTKSTADQKVAAEYAALGIGNLTGEAAELGEAMFAQREQQIRARDVVEQHVKALDALADAMREVGSMDVMPAGGELIAAAEAHQRGHSVGLGEVPVVAENLGPPPEMFTQWEEFGLTVKGALAEVSDSIASTQSLVGGLFAGMARGMEQSIAGWLLYGGSLGKMIKQMTAQVLAGIAAQSAVKAIFELAEGFASLFFNPAAAAAHFKAAALYGAAAVAAGIGAKAFAGGGGSAYAGSGGGSDGGESIAGQREDYRTRYNREQGEQGQHTRREDRRGGDLVLQINGREIARASLDALRDGGDLQDGYRRAVGVLA